MEREYKCRFLGEFIGIPKALTDIPIYECEAPEETNPSFAGKASFEDDSTKDFCRLATASQLKCSAYQPSEEVGKVINIANYR